MSGPSEQPQQLVPEAFISHSSAQRDFVLYLGARLQAHALQYFSSSEPDAGCTPGRPFDESLLQHVRGARVVVVVLSQEYFGSKWCMKELQEAIDRQKDSPEKVLLPVFYGWRSPAELRDWLGKSEQQHLQDSCLEWTGQPLLQLWDRVSSMHGLKFSPGDSNPQLADQVLQIVRHYIPGPGYSEQQVVGASAWVDWAIEHLLQQEGRLGICGMGGCGKTTLTMLLYDRLHEQFDGRVARVQVGQQPSDEHLVKLQHHILKQVCKVKEPREFIDSRAGAAVLRQSLLAENMPKFLIILDDLWEDDARPKMLRCLLPRGVAKACSSKGSWVVVATRDKDIVTTLLGTNTAHTVPALDDSCQWEVVQLNAESQLEDLSKADRQVLLKTGNKLPLKLQLLGAQLNTTEPEDHKDVLRRIRYYGNPAKVTKGLDAAFITSYEALLDEHKLPFLDIALFMRGEPKFDVIDWCNAIHSDPVDGGMADDVVRALEHRALVRWAGGDDDPVEIHDELRDFALRCVRPLPAVLNKSPKVVAFRWEKQAVSWESGSSSWPPKRVVAIDCRDPTVLVRSLPGNPGYPVPLQPKMDSLEVLVMRYKDASARRLQLLRVQDLDNLKFLDIRECRLKRLHLGRLPSLAGLLMTHGMDRPHKLDVCLGSLPKLQYLQAGVCCLIGTLPSSLSTYTRLQHFDLQGNSLQGELPPGLSAATNLTYLDLSGEIPQDPYGATTSSNLRGGLPPEWAHLKKLQVLDLSFNSITGELPPGWSVLTDLQFLDLSGNLLKGRLPDSWSNMCNLEDLRLDNNNLWGLLPPDWSTLDKLDTLTLGNNWLGWEEKACLPPSWSNLMRLTCLDVSNCYLQGPIPEEWSSLQQLEFIALQGGENSLGPTPQWLLQRQGKNQPPSETVDLASNDAPYSPDDTSWIWAIEGGGRMGAVRPHALCNHNDLECSDDESVWCHL